MSDNNKNYNYNYNYSADEGNQNQQKQNGSDFPPWWFIILMFMVFWPAGIIFLIKKLSSGNTPQNKKYYYDSSAKENTANNKKTKQKPSSALKTTGIILLAISALTFFSDYGYHDISDLSMIAFFALGGISALWYSSFEKRKLARFEKYKTIINTRKNVDISSIAGKIPVSVKKATRDLEEMINRGYFKGAYIDSRKNVLVYPGFEQEEEQQSKNEQIPATGDAAELNKYKKYIDDLKSVNEKITNEDLSSQISQIEDISKKIFAYVGDNPSKKTMIRSFLQYYLPTTLKILNAYADFEQQGINGMYLSSGKQDIQNTMTKLVASYEKLLDKLYMSEVIDVSTELEALEGMLVNDGYAEGDLTLKI